MPEVVASASLDADGNDQLFAAAAQAWEEQRLRVLGASMDRGNRMWDLARGVGDADDLDQRVAETRSALYRLIDDERHERLDGLMEVNERLGDVAAARTDQELSGRVADFWDRSARETGAWVDHAEWSIGSWAEQARRPDVRADEAADALRTTVAEIRRRAEDLDHQSMLRWTATAEAAAAN